MGGTVIQKFLAFLKLQKILGNFCFSEQIFYRKQSLGAPGLLKTLVRGLIPRSEQGLNIFTFIIISYRTCGQNGEFVLVRIYNRLKTSHQLVAPLLRGICRDEKVQICAKFPHGKYVAKMGKLRSKSGAKIMS